MNFKEGIITGAGIMVGFILVGVAVKMVKNYLPSGSQPVEGVALF